MLLINRLLQNGAPLGRTTLLPFAELKLPKVALNYDELVGALLEDRLIEGNAETFILTSLGEQRLAAVASEYSLHAWFYNEYYEAIRISRAHSLLCERVYGKDLGQHGMADMEQVHSALSALGVSSGMSLLDFGCGDGQITEYIADTTGADVTGVDIAGEGDPVLAQVRTAGKRDRLHLYCANLEVTPEAFPNLHFDRILAIDSLFFASDQQVMTQRLLERLKPGGKMGVFMNAPPHTPSGEIKLAAVIDAQGWHCRVQDYYCRKSHALGKKETDPVRARTAFQGRRQRLPLINRLAECDGMVDTQRYFFLIEQGHSGLSARLQRPNCFSSQLMHRRTHCAARTSTISGFPLAVNGVASDSPWMPSSKICISKGMPARFNAEANSSEFSTGTTTSVLVVKIKAGGVLASTCFSNDGTGQGRMFDIDSRMHGYARSIASGRTRPIVPKAAAK